VKGLGILAVITLLSWNQVSAQADSSLLAMPKPKPNRYISIGASANSYKGSLSNRYSIFTPGVHLGLQFNNRKRINGSFELFYGHVAGDQLPTLNKTRTDGRTPATNFSTTLFIASYNLKLNLINARHVRWYVGTGFGITRFTVKDSEGNDLLPQNITRASGETYSNVTVSFPLYTGVNYHLDNGIALGLQAGWWNTATPYLDNMDKLGSTTGNDNVAFYRLNLLIPFSKVKK